MSEPYRTEAPTRAEVDAMAGAVVVQFGTGWCGWCRAAEPLIDEAFAGFPGVTHLSIEDGPGRPLGRSFRVKLWPTLIFLRDGHEVARVTRPADAAVVKRALAQANEAGTA